MLTINTPYGQMHEEFWSDFKKCEYWVDKQMHQKGDTYQKAVEAVRNHAIGAELPVIEWISPTGNRWNNYCQLNQHSNRMIAMQYDSVLYWETLGSFGVFWAMQFDGEQDIVIAPGHFWQRVCERTPKYIMHGVGTCLDFFRDHMAMEKHILPPREGDCRRQLIIDFNGGVGYGVEVSQEYHIFEMRTWVDESQLTGWRKKQHEQAGLVDELAKKGYFEMKSLCRMYPDRKMYELLPMLSSDAVREAFVKQMWKGSEACNTKMTPEERDQKSLQAYEYLINLMLENM